MERFNQMASNPFSDIVVLGKITEETRQHVVGVITDPSTGDENAHTFNPPGGMCGG